MAQVPALALSPADLLLYLCLHTAKHTYDLQLRMLCDIGEVVQRFSAEMVWQEIGARAEQWESTHAVYMILRLAKELLDVDVPADWLVSLQPASFDEHYLDLARQQFLGERIDGGMGKHVQIARLWELKGLGNKIAIIGNSLFPARESMAIMYPASKNSWRIYLYYPVRIKDVLIRHGVTLLRLARGDIKTRAAAGQINQVSELHDWLIGARP
jgi:hypothetical protein